MEPVGSYLPSYEINGKGEISTGLLQGERDVCFVVWWVLFSRIILHLETKDIIRTIFKHVIPHGQLKLQYICAVFCNLQNALI